MRVGGILIKPGKREPCEWEVVDSLVAGHSPEPRLYLCFLGSATTAGKEYLETVPVPIWRAKVA